LNEKADVREKDLRQLVEESFTGAAAALALKAHDCAAERWGEGFAEQTRAIDILLSQHAAPGVIAGAFLALLRQHGYIEASEIRSRFGETLAMLVEKVFAEEILRTDTEAHRKQDLRYFLRSISGDLRAALLRFALRLAELERLADRDDGGRRDMAQETLDLYVPLADRIGMGVLRTRLEDVCFRILRPTLYEELAQRLEPIRAEDEACLALLMQGAMRLLKQHGIVGAVHGRAKGLYSLGRKMCRLKCSLQEIMDRIGLRIIVSSVEECYTVLELLHTHFRPVPGTFDDYIGSPKQNGYQSLHTCVYPATDVSHKPVEFQIRTEAMHQEAEHGIAAHWLYKSEAEAKFHSERQLEWLHSLLSQRERAANHREFIECLRQQVFDNRPVFLDNQSMSLQTRPACTKKS